MDKINLHVIRESFGRVVYSHKTHEKDAEISSCHAVATKWTNIILTTLTSGTLISTIITNQNILIYISAILATLTLAFIIFQLSFNPEKNKSTSYIPIMSGCDNFCTYCVVPYTRGKEISRPVDDIISEIKNLVENGINEVTLLGQNVNSYKLTKEQNNKETKKQDFVILLEKIEKIKNLKKISFLTSHPKDIGEDLINWMANSVKFSKQLHLPVQSGDNEILKKMNRHYTSEQYLHLIENCKLKIENLCLTTDVIVGFPSETQKQFENTVKLCKKVKFNMAFISKYSPRPGTPSAKMKDNVPQVEKKRRWKILNDLINKKRTDHIDLSL